MDIVPWDCKLSDTTEKLSIAHMEKKRGKLYLLLRINLFINFEKNLKNSRIEFKAK